jgi:hypothetical protein
LSLTFAGLGCQKGINRRCWAQVDVARR